MAETTIKDLVLIHIDNKPAFYARIEDINADVKPGWWQVKLLVLTLPLQVFNWTLDTSQVGGEPFTMGGTPVRLERVASPVDSEAKSAGDKAPREQQGKEGGKVVSLAERKKKDLNP